MVSYRLILPGKTFNLIRFLSFLFLLLFRQQVKKYNTRAETDYSEENADTASHGNACSQAITDQHKK